MTLDDVFPGLSERLGASFATHDSFASECVTWPLVADGRDLEVTVRRWDLDRLSSGAARRFAFSITDAATGERLAHGTSSNAGALSAMIVNARRRLAPARTVAEPLPALAPLPCGPCAPCPSRDS